jgi:hypothetical protein
VVSHATVVDARLVVGRRVKFVDFPLTECLRLGQISIIDRQVIEPHPTTVRFRFRFGGAASDKESKPRWSQVSWQAPEWIKNIKKARPDESVVFEMHQFLFGVTKRHKSQPNGMLPNYKPRRGARRHHIKFFQLLRLRFVQTCDRSKTEMIRRPRLRDLRGLLRAPSEWSRSMMLVSTDQLSPRRLLLYIARIARSVWVAPTLASLSSWALCKIEPKFAIGFPGRSFGIVPAVLRFVLKEIAGFH